MPEQSLTKHREYVYKLYDGMSQMAVEENGLTIYRGYLTHLMETLEIPRPHWTNVKRRLIATGSVECIVMGVRNILSEYVLHHHPSESAEGWATEDLTRSPGDATLRQQIENLHKSLGGINIGEALVEITERLGRVEEKVGITKRGTSTGKAKGR